MWLYIQMYHKVVFYKRVAKKKPQKDMIGEERHVIFSDESRCCQFGDSGQRWVWCHFVIHLEDPYLK